MSRRLSMSDLSPAEMDLVEILQLLRYGRIEGLLVKDGEPVLSPPPQIVQEIKLKSDPGKKTIRPAESELKNQVVELLRQIRMVGDGTIRSIEVQNGLPFRIVIDGLCDAASLRRKEGSNDR